MMSLIRILFISLIFSSCSTNINYGYFEMYANAIFKERINIDTEFIDSVDYSFIKARYNRNEATLVLASIENGIMEWVGADLVTIKTKEGTIVETSGLASNISYYAEDVSNQLNKISNFPDYSLHLYIDSPELIHTRVDFRFLNKEFKQIMHGGSKKLVEQAIYEKRSSSIGWKSDDIFYIKDGLVIKTSQNLTPLAGKIEIEFYYK